MDYSYLRNLISVKKFTVDKVSALIGRSRNWFKMAEANDSMTVKDLEAILKILGLTLSDFFKESNTVNEPSNNEAKLKEENLELLKENRQLRLRIEALEGKGNESQPEKNKPKLYK